MEYKYEIHCHTKEVSPCAKASARELLEFYKDAGYSGVCITNHLYHKYEANGNNTDFDSNIDFFIKGYEIAYEEGKRIGIDVFFGWERGFGCWYGGNDFLTYGLSPEWLKAQKDIFELEAWDYCDRVRSAGGYVIHAHPFREADYINSIILMPRRVDGVEVYNSCRNDFENGMAEIYAEKYMLPKFKGSDNHVGYMENPAAMFTDFRASSINDVIKFNL